MSSYLLESSVVDCGIAIVFPFLKATGVMELAVEKVILLV
jgi:hypothetical protein